MLPHSTGPGQSLQAEPPGRRRRLRLAGVTATRGMLSRQAVLPLARTGARLSTVVKVAVGAPVARSRPHTAQNRPPPRPARRKRGNTTPESHSVPVPSLASLSHLRIHMAHGGGSEDAHATQSCVLAATIPYRQSARPLAPDMRLISANIKLDILTYTNSPVYFPQSARQVFQSGDRSLSPWGQESPSTVIRGAGGGAVHMGDAGRPSLPYHGENEGRRSTYRNRIPHEAISSQHASTRINTHQHASTRINTHLWRPPPSGTTRAQRRAHLQPGKSFPDQHVRPDLPYRSLW